ncbi:hypothetical protein RSK20926_21689 [Roseobacter sp. SK209-2-6]|uniref:hypothetical protein n=1 Tax=Roseobacter sp. SK209-2-6 TaxID=388739 RepID=UPI0000F3F336|nr:hypothetical protein [Roseobacter sp. SK209-2-6]EBA16381.1 hypothetical protein RSK20926_21689 [Roseobacter sp. SK209-2-6]
MNSRISRSEGFFYRDLHYFSPRRYEAGEAVGPALQRFDQSGHFGDIGQGLNAVADFNVLCHARS